ncbi:AbrB family transcriptional regulator [Chachezhania sediminis]|uniref:AbrB family transcriptional regulator n=1 Tax=Chachezhania sediminis TaxID=2599291 RepID=UPI001E5A2FC6|nr:AbrB family transcriptional regulator [Chachezhania sediminis]
MPFLIGSLVSVGVFAMAATAMDRQLPAFPQGLRRVFVGVIGVMIGQRFTTDLASQIPALWPSLLAVLPFVAVTQAANFAIFRYIGKYDGPTAFFSAMPGGLIEAITIGEQQGGNVQVLTIQHFVRIVLVVITVPTLFLIFSGHSVGSAAGQQLSVGPWTALDVVLIVAVALIGAPLAVRIHLPAPMLLGPMILSAACHATGLMDTHSPSWLLHFSQLVVGTGLGATFARTNPRQLLNAFLLGVLTLAVMLGLACVFAFSLTPFVPISTETLFVSYAPGGVTEMSLIALSLGVTPVVVTVHHIVRITTAIVLITTVPKRWYRDDEPPNAA